MRAAYIDDVAGKTRMQKIEIIRKEIDNKLESGEKFARTCLEQLFAYMKGTVPPLEPTESTEEAEQNAGATGVKSGKKERRGKNKKRANRTRDSGEYFESARENKSGPVLAAQRI